SDPENPYDFTSKQRWSTAITGFDFADTGKKFSFKFKFSNPAGAKDDMYVRTNKEEFMYYGVKNGTTCTTLSGEFDGWYEVTGTITNSDNTRFTIEFNSDAVNEFTNNDILYITDFRFGPEGAMQPVNNSDIGVAVRSDITPVKSIVTLESLSE
ncbi:MAG: hypothetical protein J6Z02_00635, partial [Lachnospiraceae bacterium]|nr:hypothetical protein [Lachnospiraceae bacterium]